MKTKYMVLLALVLCMGAFLLPMTAYAAEDGGRLPDTTSPTVQARITGDILRIEASDTGTGVEAVYINGIRFNYRVDGALDVSARDYAGTSKQISVCAVDFAGNKSETVKIDNPYYVTPAATPAPIPTPQQSSVTPTPPPGESESAIPADTTNSGAFTPDGTGTVVDNITEQNGKEFFTITTEAGNVFYLIIDRERSGENVYLLNAVTEADLMALAEKSEKSGNSGQSAIPTPPAETKPPDTSQTEKPAAEPAKADSGGNSGMMIFLVIAVLAAGGAGYYFKIVKPKRQAVSDEDYEDDEEMEFEDEGRLPDEPEETDDEADFDGGDGDEDYESEAEDGE